MKCFLIFLLLVFFKVFLCVAQIKWAWIFTVLRSHKHKARMHVGNKFSSHSSFTVTAINSIIDIILLASLNQNDPVLKAN